MATQVQFRGGTTTEHASFNGAAREVTVDTTKQTLVVQDGSTNGGFPLLGEKNADNVTVNFGTGDDLQIYHDGSNSYIKDTGTGDLFISGKNNIRFLDYGTNEDMAKMTSDGAVELFYDGGKKFETNVDGIEIYGNCLMDADNRKIILGASDDLQIYHDGSHSYIKDAGTGDLRILSSELNIQNAAGTETQAYFAEDGAVALYYDGSKKFETVSDGVKLAADNSTLYIGAGGDLRLWHNGTNSNLVNITGDLLVRSGGLHIQNAAGTETQAYFADDGAVDLYYDGSKKFETYAYGIKTTQNIMIGTHAYWEDNGEAIFGDDADLKIYHDGSNSIISDTGTGNLNIYTNGTGVNIHSNAGENIAKFIKDGGVEIYYDNSKKFETRSDGVVVTGLVNGFTNEADAQYGTNYLFHKLQQDDNNWTLCTENSHDTAPYGILIKFSDCSPDNNTNKVLDFSDNSATRFVVYSDGDVWTSDAGTLTSDETLKENITDATSKLEDIKKLKVRNFNWKSSFHPEKSKKKQIGFIAQEVEEVFPALVNEYDISPDAGNIDHTPIMKKSIKAAWDPIIIKAMQELITKVETLEAKVAALEAG